MAFSKTKTQNKLVSKSKTPQKPKKLSSKKLARKSGPRLPSSMLKEIGQGKSDKSDSEANEEERNDFYEYEEQIPEEESKKNRRYDPVENYEYEMPEDIEDEDVPSDEDEDIKSDESGGDDEGEGNKHLKMLERITGIRGEAFQEKEESQVILSDFQGDSNKDKLSINDLLDPLYGKSNYGELRKSVQQLQEQPTMAPLPKVQREKLERKVAYEFSKKDITKWEPLVKRNREAPTLYFHEEVSLGVPTVGAISSGFEPKTDFEKKMKALVHDPKVAEAHRNDGAKLLELNKVSIEEVRERQKRLAKMRSLLFRHEMKAKHVKKIKSKTYHRILKKEKQKAVSAGMELLDPDEAKELARKQEFKRAEERLTLKHKNKSKWAKRILKRGLQAQDEGTRAALTEQLNEHATLTRKMNSMNDSSDDESSNDDDDASDDDILKRAKNKTLDAIEEKDETPKDGVFGLPFMQRALEKQKAAVADEARIALQEYESSLGHLKNDDYDEGHSKPVKSSGRKVFGGSEKQPEQPKKKYKLEDTGNSDSEDDLDHKESENMSEVNNEADGPKFASALIDDDLVMDQNSVFKNFDDIAKDPGPKTTCDVAIFASGSWKKAKDVKTENKKTDAPAPVAKDKQDVKETDQDHDSESEEELEVGTLSFEPKSGYELPSQADLIHDAFAGDDVEAEFEKDKMEILNEENPEPEKPTLVPGWGQWTNIQLKRGPPSWMIEEHEKAKKKRDEALKKRTDYKFKNVIITERVNKKTEKLMTKTVPFPYKSKDVYEQSIRMPLGPDYNPAISVGALNRPSVVKKAGVIIKPIKYEEVDPSGKEDEPKHTGNKGKESTKLRNAKGKNSYKKASK